MTTSLLIDLTLPVCLAVGFFAGYVLRFRLRTWGSFVLSLGMVVAVSGWLASFSIAGFVLILLGITLFGAGASGMAFAGRAAR
jgi:hypothetical protein